MYKVLIYLKYIGIFFLLTLLIAITSSLFSLTSLSMPLINKLAIILNAISFFFISSLASHKTKEKGYKVGLKLGLLFILLLILINLIFLHTKFSIDRIIYYIILLASSILGGSFGKNRKQKN